MQRNAMTMTALAGLMLGVTVLTGGCVKQENYDDLMTTNRSLREQLVALEDERDGLEANLQAVRGQLDQTSSELNAMQGSSSSMNSSLSTLQADYNRLLEEVATLEMGGLPGDVQFALEQMAREHPELVTFDSSKGMLRFASDFTFPSGSAEVRDDAANTLGDLARVLNNAGANLEVRIIGHTDSQKPSQPATLRNHPTNRHLSVHRAISVGRILESAGVDPVRIMVAGYGESRPVVANGPRGAAANRRVEIFLAPMPNLSQPMGGGESPAPASGSAGSAGSPQANVPEK